MLADGTACWSAWDGDLRTLLEGRGDGTAERAGDGSRGARSRGPRAAPSFAHASEAEIARILDFYEVRWEYEPDTFPIALDLDGDVVESFSPDFYLPDLDLYLEMTTLKQKLVRKKNRKLRRLRELYPDLRVKLFYARDFRALMLKFGRLALLDDLSGTPGQSTLPGSATVGSSSEAARPASCLAVVTAVGCRAWPISTTLVAPRCVPTRLARPPSDRRTLRAAGAAAVDGVATPPRRAAAT